MAEPFLSEIRIMSFDFPPKGWALCNGQLLPINQNQALFSLLGTTFGGDGRVNFAPARTSRDGRRSTWARATRSASAEASRPTRSRSPRFHSTRTCCPHRARRATSQFRTVDVLATARSEIYAPPTSLTTPRTRRPSRTSEGARRT